MFIKTFASSEPTLQNLEVVEVKIANVENSSYKIINTLVVPLICNPLSDQCVSIAKNQYDHLKYLKGATKSCFAHCSFVVFILFNTGLRKSAFSTNSFRKLVSILAFCLFCLLCVEFDVIFMNFITFAQSLFIMVSRNLCFCSDL